jgi:hypothetical protein
MPANRIVFIAFAILMLLVVVYVFRHIQGDPVERDRLNPEQRPRVELLGLDKRSA